jgi:hypothetical protein
MVLCVHASPRGRAFKWPFHNEVCVTRFIAQTWLLFSLLVDFSCNTYMYVHMIWLLSFVGHGGPSELTNAVDCEIHLRSLAKMHFVSKNRQL